MRTRPEFGFDATDEGDDLVVDGLIHHSAFPVVSGRLSTWSVSKNFSRSYCSTAITATTGRPCLDQAAPIVHRAPPFENRERNIRQRDAMRRAALHAFAGNAPLPRFRIHLGPRRAARLPGSRGSQDEEPEAEFRCRTRPGRLHPLERPGDFPIGQRPEVRLHRWHDRPIRGRPRGRSPKAKTRSQTAGRSSGSSAEPSHPVGPRGRENPARRCVLSDSHALRRTPPRKRTVSITPCTGVVFRSDAPTVREPSILCHVAGLYPSPGT